MDCIKSLIAQTWMVLFNVFLHDACIDGNLDSDLVGMDMDLTHDTRKHLVVIGSGWAAVSLVKFQTIEMNFLKSFQIILNETNLFDVYLDPKY